MNVCALDVVARTADFESVASSLELRGWEWDLLHGADGETTLGDIVHRMGIDMDSAVGFVHEALHRGLLAVGTMSLSAYRARMPMQTALTSTAAPLSLGTSQVAEPAEEAPAETHGSISFSSDAFDWTEPDATFDDADADVPVIQTPPPAPSKTITAHVGGVHYDERFGVEHPDGPFAAAAVAAGVADTATQDATTHDVPSHDTAPHDAPQHADVAEPFAVAADPIVHTEDHDEPAVAAPHGETAHAEAAHTDDPFAARHDAEPFAAAEHVEQPVDDPFAMRAPEPEPEPDAAAAPATAFGIDASRFDEPFLPTHEAVAAAPAPVATEISHEHEYDIPSEAAARTNGHATIAQEPVEESIPGSISFSFSPDEPFDDHEVTYEAPSRTRAPGPPPSENSAADATPAAATTIEHHDEVAAATPAESETQSTYFEREAIDTDASRELDEKAKSWKDSLSWREQQELNAAMETGKEKQGVIGSLLRALGVR